MAREPRRPGDLTTDDPEVRTAVVGATATENQEDALLELMQYFFSRIHLKKAVTWMLKVMNTAELCQKRKELNTTLAPPEVDKE